MKKETGNPPPTHRGKQQDRAQLPYRRGVGIALFNSEGKVFIGSRIDNPGAWQLPQGGIDDGEDPLEAVFRELEEEVGTRKAKIVAVMEEWIPYEFPDYVLKTLGGQHRGQIQKWIALEFTGSDADIRLDAHSHPEFEEWKWVPLEDLLGYAIHFKRDVYRRVVAEFRPVARQLGGR